MQWLRDWLKHGAPEIDKLKAQSRTPYYWVQASNFNIPLASKLFRVVVQGGIKPVPDLALQ